MELLYVLVQSLVGKFTRRGQEPNVVDVAEVVKASRSYDTSGPPISDQLPIFLPCSFFSLFPRKPAEPNT